jgi:chromate transporter
MTSRDGEQVAERVPNMPRLRARGLLTGMLTAGLIGFGGGSALIPVIEREVVSKRHLLDEKTYLRHAVVANVTPGALPVKLAAQAGQVVSGAGLAVAAALTVAVPGVLGTMVILAGSQAIGPNAIDLITRASVGITCFIIVLLVGYISKVLGSARGIQLAVFVAITALSAVLNGSGPIVRVALGLVGRNDTQKLPHLGAVQVILIALGAIALYSLLTGHRAAGANPEPSPPAADLGRIWRGTAAFVGMVVGGLAILWALAGLAGLSLGGLLALSTVSSFGGGEAYIGVADGFFVRSGLIDTDEFFTQLVPITNALPGPILVKVAAGVGYLFGGSGISAWSGGIAAMLITVGSCSALALPLLGLYDSLQHHPLMVNIGRYMLPVICGLLLQVSASMLEVSESIAASHGISASPLLWVSVVTIAGLTVLHLRKLVPDLALLVACGAASVLVLGL